MQDRFAKKSTPAPIEFTAWMFGHCRSQSHMVHQRQCKHAILQQRPSRVASVAERYHFKQLIGRIPTAEQPKVSVTDMAVAFAGHAMPRVILH